MFKRVFRLIRGWMNFFLGKAEDPKLLAGELISEMALQKAEATKGVAMHISHEKMAEKKMFDFQAQAASWEEKAALAVSRGRDDLAIEALKKKESAEATAEEYRKQLQSSRAATSQLKEQLRLLDSKIEQAKNKKDIIIAKQARAEAQQRIQNTLGGFAIDNSAFETLERMEEKVDQMQSLADANMDLNEEFSGSSVEEQFRKMENETQANDALTALKLRMGLSVVNVEAKQEEELVMLEKELGIDVSQAQMKSSR